MPCVHFPLAGKAVVKREFRSNIFYLSGLLVYLVLVLRALLNYRLGKNYSHMNFDEKGHQFLPSGFLFDGSTSYLIQSFFCMSAEIVFKTKLITETKKKPHFLLG